MQALDVTRLHSQEFISNSKLPLLCKQRPFIKLMETSFQIVIHCTEKDQKSATQQGVSF